MDTRINYSGLVIAGIGFFLTRFTVTLAIYETSFRFYLAGVIPLALGLGLAAFGVAIAVVDIEADHARTTAIWCVIGTGAMLILVLLTLLGSTTSGTPDFASVRSRTYLSNFLIGGSIGGTLTGLYASHNKRQHDELQRQANRLEILNRLLRHEVLNAVTAIKGYAVLDSGTDSKARTVITDRSNAIEQTINDVKFLARSARSTAEFTDGIDLYESLHESAARVMDAYPDVHIEIPSSSTNLVVRADERLPQVFTHLLENAVLHTPAATPQVTLTETERTVMVSVSDDGPGLPTSQQALLETGDIAEFDNPNTGFGLNIVRLLVEDYDGELRTSVDDSGTTITVILPRVDAPPPDLAPSRADLVGVRPAIPHLVVILVAALVAGVLYGVAAEQLGGSVGFIGVYYGIQNSVVGWITHEFHSVVFAFVFAGLVSVAPTTYRNSVLAFIAIGTVWGIVLWIVAAGVISPIWLRLLGIPAPLPSLSPRILVSHLIWGSSLGALTAYGYRYVTPLLGAPSTRLDSAARRD